MNSRSTSLISFKNNYKFKLYWGKNERKEDPCLEFEQLQNEVFRENIGADDN